MGLGAGFGAGLVGGAGVGGRRGGEGHRGRDVVGLERVGAAVVVGVAVAASKSGGCGWFGVGEDGRGGWWGGVRLEGRG